MKKLLISTIATICVITVCFGIYIYQTSLKSTNLIRQNIAALADDPIVIPCIVGGKKCTFDVEITEVNEEGEEVQAEYEMTIEGLKNKE